MDSSEYKDVVLGPIFLRYVEDAIEERRAAHRRLLTKYRYPPDKQVATINLVMRQARLLAAA